MDVHSTEQRSRNMAAIRGKNTKPELVVRALLRSLGYRYRLHGKSLPGKPDIVLSKHKTVIFVHGCFWHCHDCRFGRVVPATRAEFWKEKRAGTVQRDERNQKLLIDDGWRVITIWECELRDLESLTTQLKLTMKNNS